MSNIGGINPVISSIEAKRVKKIYVSKSFKNQRILDLAKKNKLSIVYTENSKLSTLFKGNHQGVVAEVIPFLTYSLEEVIKDSKTVERPIIVVLDELNDPHNLGAVLRSGDIFNISAIIYKKDRQVSLNDTAAKVSTGAINYVKCVEVTNISQALKKLKDNGFWVVGLDGKCEQYIKDIDHNLPLVIVLGSEGKGISRLVLENCDFIAKIPMFGHVSCLNASVALGIALYEFRR